MQNYEIESFSCLRDGLTLRGHIYNRSGSKNGTVILSHGFTSSEKTTIPYARDFASRGYAAVTFDFAGGGIVCSSDGRNRDMTVYTEEADLLAVYAAVLTELSTTPDRVVLMGFSQGGYVSALAAPKLPGLAALILFYPAFCIPDDARRGSMQSYRFDPENIPEIIGTEPMEIGRDYAASVLKSDPYTEIAGVSCPVLLVHGTADTIVPISYSDRAEAVYPNCRYERFEDAGHGFLTGCFDRALTVLREFLPDAE